MKIRPARLNDVSDLQGLWIELMDHHSKLDSDYRLTENADSNWADYIRSKFENKNAALIVAVCDERLVGYIGALVREYPPVYTIKKYGFIEEIAVTRNYRRKGIASQLWCAAEDWLLSQEVTRIKVNVDAANPESQSFFRNQGFLDSTETLLKKY